MANILIADDEVALRFLLRETLVDEGYDVREASDGQEAIEKLTNHQFDIVILDYMMPEKTGIEVCEWLRKSDSINQNAPVILLTAKTQMKDREKASEAGISTYMAKPFSPFQLLDEIELLLNRQK
ncbi:response regulator transcription factor [Brevibacillus daliensis]|uniref:response regulator transcription factor n=1 Tax=Brevibacillus daliensis TaxID=2892995 RepID=UPI001E3F9A8A|nr:response regulator [Brevibacillus daliensis]